MELKRFFKRKWHWFAAGAIVAVQIALMALFMVSASPVYDEPAYLCGGLNKLNNNDYSLTPDGGTLLQTWIALPNLNLEFPPPSKISGETPRFYLTQLRQVFEAAGIDGVYLKSRCMVALLNVFCGLIIFLLAMRIAGRMPAVLTLALYAFLPVALSNGAVATADMGACFASLLCCLCFGELLRKQKMSSIVFAGVSAAVFALTKNSAFIMVPTTALLIAFATFAGGNGRLGRFLRISGAFALAFLCAWIALWAVYGFRYGMNAPGVNSGMVPLKEILDGGIVSKVVGFAAERKLLPEAYLYGIMNTRHVMEGGLASLNGEVSSSGFYSFFPQVFLMKMPPGALLAIGIGFAALCMTRRKRVFNILLPFLLFAGIYLAVAIVAKLNLGIRHILPLFPALMLMSALGFRALLKANKLLKALAFLLVLSCAVEACLASPYQLAYFNPFFGGQKNAWKHVADSSLDWGQDLKTLKGSLEKLGIRTDGSEKIYLAYFGAEPPYACGFPARTFPFPVNGQFPSRRHALVPGVYCISATLLQGFNLRSVDIGILNDKEKRERLVKSFKAIKDFEERRDYEGLKEALKSSKQQISFDCLDFELLRFEILCRGLRLKEPLGSAGHSILIYKLGEEDLRSLFPPEVKDFLE